MTRHACDSTRFSKFSGWLRALGTPPEFRKEESPAPFSESFTSVHISNQNLDYVWHNHKRNWLITIEEKTRGGMLNNGAAFAQRDTHAVLSGMLAFASENDCYPKNARGGFVKVSYRGHYLIVLENTSPSDGAIAINGIDATTDDLLHILLHGFWPDGAPGTGTFAKRLIKEIAQ